MPEGDTVFRTAARLHEALAGQVLTVADLRWPSLATVELRGMRTEAVVSRGKHLLHRLDSGLTVHSHLRMEGQWRIVGSARLDGRTLADRQLRAVLGGQLWTALGLRLGMLDIVATADEGVVVGHLGPDLLGADWSTPLAVQRLIAGSGGSTDGADAPPGARGGTLGAALLDQRNLAGIGTMYAAETLFLQRLGPWTAVSELSPEQLTMVVERARRLLVAGCRQAVQSTTGSRARGETTYVHGRSGRPCRRCGTSVRVAPIGPPGQERTMFYCPSCQGGLGQTDDGRPQRPLGA